MTALRRIRTVYGKVLRNAVISDLEYRSSYYILFLASWITVAMELALVKQIYQGRAQVGDWPAHLMPAFVVLGMFVRYGSVLWSMVSESVDEIRNGNFRRFLLQPIYYPSYFLAKAVGPKLPTWALSLATILILKAFFGFDELLPPGTRLEFLTSIVLSYTLMWQIYLFFVYLGFWIEEAQFLSIAFNMGVGVFSGSLLPLEWFPDGLVRFLRLTPLHLLGDFPLRAGLGKLEAGEFEVRAFQCLIWILLMVPVLATLYRRALKRYEAYGG